MADTLSERLLEAADILSMYHGARAEDVRRAAAVCKAAEEEWQASRAVAVAETDARLLAVQCLDRARLATLEAVRESFDDAAVTAGKETP